MAFDFDSLLNTNLGNLIKQQKNFISGIDPSGSVSTPLKLHGGFDPALGDLLGTGGLVDVTGIGEAARSEGERFFRDRSNDISSLAAGGFIGGGVGSSAQTAALARALADTGTRIGEETLRAEVGARENAQNRRVSALDAALGQGSLGLQNRGLDQDEARLGLQSRTNQAGAGQDLIDALLKGLPFLGGRGGAGGPGTNPLARLLMPKKNFGVQTDATTTGVGPRANPFAGLSRNLGLAPFASGIGNPEYVQQFNNDLFRNSNNRLAQNAAVVGGPAAGAMSQQGTQALAQLLGMFG